MSSIPVSLNNTREPWSSLPRTHLRLPHTYQLIKQPNLSQHLPPQTHLKSPLT
jgi:hypothetical protein